MLAMVEVQTLAVTALKADSALMGKITGIWDEPPVDAVYPFISLGPHTEIANPTFGHQNAKLIFYLHVWWASDNIDQGGAIVSDCNRILFALVNTDTPNYSVSFLPTQTVFQQDPLHDVRQMPASYTVYAFERLS